jgi:nitroreductase
MGFEALVKKRKSVRNFSKKKVSWKSAVNAIDAALQGPYAGNYMNLKFIIIEEEKMIKSIADYCEQSWISDSSLLIVVCSDETHVESMYGERGRIYSRQQAGAAIQTIMLSLAEENVGSCWVGAYSDDTIRDALKIPPQMQIEAIIAAGYEDKKSVEPKKEKNSLDTSMFWEKWAMPRRPSLFEERSEDYQPSEPV